MKYWWQYLALAMELESKSFLIVLLILWWKAKKKILGLGRLHFSLVSINRWCNLLLGHTKQEADSSEMVVTFLVRFGYEGCIVWFKPWCGMAFIYWAEEKLKAQQNEVKNSAKLIDGWERENDVMEFWCCNHFSIFFSREADVWHILLFMECCWHMLCKFCDLLTSVSIGCV